MLNLKETIQKVLAKNSWGLYYKVDPLQKVNVQNGDFYKINEVDVTDFLKDFDKTIQESLQNKEK